MQGRHCLPCWSLPKVQPQHCMERSQPAPCPHHCLGCQIWTACLPLQVDMGSDEQLRSSPPATHFFVASGRLAAGVADSPDGRCTVSLLAEGTSKQQQGQALPLRVELLRISADGQQMEVLANAEIFWAGQHTQQGTSCLQCCCSASASTQAMLIWQPGGDAAVWKPPRGGLLAH